MPGQRGNGLLISGLSLLWLVACEDPPAPPAEPTLASVDYDERHYQDYALNDSLLYDRILGSLVGSAIGDAMGAPTEMWNPTAIADEYGHIDSLDMVLREPSPEGPWHYNLPPGAGTDDTRWKDLTVAYLVSEHAKRGSQLPLRPTAQHFSEFLNAHYAEDVAELRRTEGLDPEPLEDAMRRVTWLQEWTRVTRAYAAGDIDGYRDALSRFYGGEMSCAGMLYAPVLGLAYPGRPEAAYAAAHELALFDIGYARDITGMTAALTAAACGSAPRPDTFLKVVRETDPMGYFRSRLLGRVAYQLYRQARAIHRGAQRITLEEARTLHPRLPPTYPYDTLRYARTQHAYRALGKAAQDVPFHAGEIYLITLTAMMMGDYDFAASMQFIVNYGRDNDTVAAVAGAILGALHGYMALPEDLRQTVVDVNRHVLDIDLEARARVLTEAVMQRR